MFIGLDSMSVADIKARQLQRGPTQRQPQSWLQAATGQ
jgi:hypothetical protein